MTYGGAFQGLFGRFLYNGSPVHGFRTPSRTRADQHARYAYIARACGTASPRWGPGVTPDVRWEGAALGPYDPVADAAFNALFDTMLGTDAACRNER